MIGKKVIIGLSGGVDSAVSAHLLLQQGFDVRAVFMKNWSEEDFGGPCPWREDLASAKTVADHLRIPLDSWNFEPEFRRRVFQAMIEEYRRGRTPNPDILCNREIKFDLFLERARQQADSVATGHYARTHNGRLYRAIDDTKDQTYFLSAVSSAALKKVLFPIGELRKTDIRRIAKKAGLPNWDREDSVGICFIGEKKMSGFLKKYISDRPGDIVTEDGHVIGQHAGLHHFTIGQRHGFGPLLDPTVMPRALVRPGQPLFVVAKDIERNTLTVASKERVHLFNEKTFAVETPHWIRAPARWPWHGTVKLRYRQDDVACTVDKQEDEWRVTLDMPQRAVTPGQYAVFYDGDECLGSAEIA